MGGYNEIETGRHNRFLQKLFSMKGGPPAPQLASEIAVMHPIFHGVENRYLESWHRYSFAASIAAVAAIQGTLRLRNPANSNMVAVIEKLTVGGEAAADQVRFGLVVTNADLVVIAPSAPNRIDIRQASGGTGGFPTSILSNSDATHQNALVTSFVGGVVANTFYDFIQDENQEIPILPGQAIDAFANTANVLVVVSYMWRERFLEDSERF